MEKTMDKIVALAKSRGFIYPGSEIYGGLANTWDYGPIGVELKNNVKKSLVAEIRYRKPIQCRCGLRHSYESADMGRFRSSRRLFGSFNGLQGVP